MVNYEILLNAILNFYVAGVFGTALGLCLVQLDELRRGVPDPYEDGVLGNVGMILVLSSIWLYTICSFVYQIIKELEKIWTKKTPEQEEASA